MHLFGRVWATIMSSFMKSRLQKAYLSRCSQGTGGIKYIILTLSSNSSSSILYQMTFVTEKAKCLLALSPPITPWLSVVCDPHFTEPQNSALYHAWTCPRCGSSVSSCHYSATSSKFRGPRPFLSALLLRVTGPIVCLMCQFVLEWVPALFLSFFPFHLHKPVSQSPLVWWVAIHGQTLWSPKLSSKTCKPSVFWLFIIIFYLPKSQPSVSIWFGIWWWIHVRKHGEKTHLSTLPIISVGHSICIALSMDSKLGPEIDVMSLLHCWMSKVSWKWLCLPLSCFFIVWGIELDNERPFERPGHKYS